MKSEGWVSELNSEGFEVFTKDYGHNLIGTVWGEGPQHLYCLGTFIEQENLTEFFQTGAPVFLEMRTHADIEVAKRNLDRFAWVQARSEVRRILAAASKPLDTQSILSFWLENLSNATPDAQGFELELDLIRGDFEEIADLLEMELPYFYSFDEGSWMQRQAQGPVEKAVPIPMRDIIDEVQMALKSRLTAIEQDMFENHNLSPELHLEGAGTADDPFYVMLRYTEADAATLQPESAAASLKN